MKACFLLLLSLVLALPAASKETRGRVVDGSGEAISYVNIGIRGTTTGTVSRRDGTFSLDIPDSLASRALSFSHVSYRPVDLPVGAEMRVAMEAADYPIEEVVVRPGKKRRLTGVGIRIPGQGVPTRTGMELGSILDVKYDFSAQRIGFTVLSCKAAALLRFNIYAIDGEEFDNIVRTPIYCPIELSDEPMRYSTELEQPVFLEAGRYFVSLEFVELGGEFNEEGIQEQHTLFFPIFLKPSYIRDNSMGSMESQPFNIGLSVSGVEYR